MSMAHAVFAALALLVTGAAVVWVLSPLRQVSRRLTQVAAATLPLLAVGGYLALGAPKALDLQAQAPAHPQAPADLDQMVQRLNARLQARPDDLEGWFMLARSHQVLEQWEPAAAAYRRALALAPDDAQLLADLADVLAVRANGELEGEPKALLERALANDPAHPKTLLLLAAAEFRQGRFGQAQARWELLARTAPDSQAGAVARESLTRVQLARGVRPAEVEAPPAAMARPPAPR
jgi:cytochrome c-type biogenesis protein CcmH